MFSPIIVGWKHLEQQTFLCVYLIGPGRTELDFVSVFSPTSSLTTGSTRDGQMLPSNSENWSQTFSCDDASELWEHHETGLQFLESTRGVRPTPTAATLAEDFVDSMRAQAVYIRSLPLWFLRVPYWYFTRRFTKHNKPIAELV